MLPIAGWPHGLNVLVNPNRIRNDELAEALNVAYTQYGVLTKRAGSSLITSLPDGVQGFGVYNRREDDGSITKYQLAVAGGKLYRIDPINKSHTEITGHTFSSTTRVVIKQGMNNVYFFDAENPIVRWDGTSFTEFTNIDPPTGVALNKTGSDTGATDYTYIVTASNGVGETIGSTSVHHDSMPATMDDSTYLTLSWDAVPDAMLYNIYRSTTGAANATYLTSTTALSFIDQSQADDTQSVTILVPDEDTTGGPTLMTGTVYHDSIVGVDASDKTKVWFTGGADKIDSFAPGDGGGWYRYHAEEGEPVTGVEVFAGLGKDYLYLFKSHKIGQASFNVDGGLTVSDVNLAIGADSDASLVAFENDFAMWSRYGGYTLRMEPNLVNVLRVSELTIRVHPSYVTSITQSALSKVCGIYDKNNHVLLWSIPTGAEENSTTLAYDPVYLGFSEYRGIAATAFSKFTDDDNNEYTYGGDSDGNIFRLFDGTSDMGTPITFRASTKSFDMDTPWNYKFITRLWLIFGNVNASGIKVTLIQDGTSILKTFAISSGTGNTGWDSDLWDNQFWDDSSGTLVSINNRLVQKYVDINRDLFSLQVTYENSTSTDSFEILGMYLLYTESLKPPPASQRIS